MKSCVSSYPSIVAATHIYVMRILRPTLALSTTEALCKQTAWWNTLQCAVSSVLGFQTSMLRLAASACLHLTLANSGTNKNQSLQACNSLDVRLPQMWQQFCASHCQYEAHWLLSSWKLVQWQSTVVAMICMPMCTAVELKICTHHSNMQVLLTTHIGQSSILLSFSSKWRQNA